MDVIGDGAFDAQIVFSLPSRIVADDFNIFARAHGITYKGVRGMWRGKYKPFTIVTPATNFLTLYTNNWFWGQEAILYLAGQTCRSGGRKAELLYMNDKDHHIPYGTWYAVSEEAAKSMSGWTYDPRQDQYYTCLDIPEGNEALPKAGEEKVPTPEGCV